MSQQLFEEINLNGHIEFQVKLDLDDSANITDSKVFAVGGHDFLLAVDVFRQSLQGPVSELQPPSGTTMPDILIREMVHRLQGRWQLPYDEPNICHCRAVPTANVDQAIIYGAHTPAKVSEMTSASTSCGTCRTDVEEMIEYRLGKKNQ